MEPVTFYTLGSVIVVSLISVIAAIPLLLKHRPSNRLLLILLSLSVGTLLGGVFIHFLPEMAAEGYTLTSGLVVLAGFFVFFLLEQFVHSHVHCHPDDHHCEHKHLAPINLAGDGIHNFIDGLIIAGSYTASIPLGIAATISVIFHEIPQEIADFGVLLYAGLSKKKALTYNLASALSALGGAAIGLSLAQAHAFADAIVPFAAGNFIYIAAANLVPELHGHSKWQDTVVHVISIALGIGVMVLLAVYAPEP